jgi:hypothetical protein
MNTRIAKTDGDAELIALARKMSELRKRENAAINHALHCEEALTASEANVDTVWDEMAKVH